MMREEGKRDVDQQVHEQILGGSSPGRFEDAGDIFEDVDPFLVTVEAEHGGEQLQMATVAFERAGREASGRFLVSSEKFKSAFLANPGKWAFRANFFLNFLKILNLNVQSVAKYLCVVANQLYK